MTTMEFRHETFAASIARLWLRVYTAGLAEEVRQRREEQLVSDLWEHQADRFGEGAAPAMVGLEVLERTVRGMPADLLWRFQLEGPKVPVNLSLSVQRMVGALLLATLVILVFSFGGALAEIDTASEDWRDKFLDWAGKSDGEVTLRLLLQLSMATGLILAAGAFYKALDGSSSMVTTMAAFAMAAAGVMLLAGAGSYWGLTEFADDVATAEISPAELATARALAITMQGLGLFGVVLFQLGAYGLALTVARARLVPGWIGLFAVAGFVASVASIPALAGGLGAAWYLQLLALAFVGLWLLSAGLALALGARGSRMVPAAA